MPFKPFSLGESIQSAQTLRSNKLKLQSMQAAQDKKTKLEGLAKMSTRPTYESYEDPDQDFAPMPEGLQQESGQVYSPEVHQQNLQAAGEIEEAAKISDAIGKMDKTQREQADYKADELAKMAFTADSPEKWDEIMPEAIEKGYTDKPVPFEMREQVLNQAQDLKNLLAGEQYTFGNVTLPDSSVVASRKSKDGRIEYRGKEGWAPTPIGSRFSNLAADSTKYVGSPNKREKEDAANLISDQWPEGTPPLNMDDRGLFEVAVASKARQLQKKEGINWDDALDRSFQDNIANVKKGEKNSFLGADWLWPDTESTFKEPSTEKPKEIGTEANPSSPKSQADFDNLKSGAWFINPADGKVLRKK